MADPTENLGLEKVSGLVDTWGTVHNGALDAIDDILDSETPSTQAFDDAADPGDSLHVARADHKHAFPSLPFPDANLLINPSFEAYLNDGSYGMIPIGWVGKNSSDPSSATSVTAETSVTDDSGTAALFNKIPATGHSKFSQFIGMTPDVPSATAVHALSGQTLTGAIRVRTATAARVYAFFETNDGTIEFSSVAHTGGSTYETLSLTFTVPDGVAWVRFGVYVSAGGSLTFYADNACVVSGRDVQSYMPRHPADNWSTIFRHAHPRHYYVERLGINGGAGYYLLSHMRNPRSAGVDRGFSQGGNNIATVREEGADVDVYANYSYSISGETVADAPASAVIIAAKLVGGSKPRQIHYAGVMSDGSQALEWLGGTPL